MHAKGASWIFLGRAALVCAVAFVSLTKVSLTQQTLQALQNQIPPAVSHGQAAVVRSLPADHQLYFSIVLPLRNQPALKDLLQRLYDPSSPDYRKFLTVDQFTAQFGPTVDDYNAVVGFAKANGFTVTDTPTNRLIVPVRGTVAQIESAFHVKMNLYQHPTEKRLFFSPDRDPLLNINVPIKGISGLSNFSIPRPAVSKATNPVSVSGSGPGGTSYLPNDMRAAYYGNGSLTGSGQCVGLAEFDGYDINDVVATFNGCTSGNCASETPSGGGNYNLTYSPQGPGGPSYTIPINNVLVNSGTVTPLPGDLDGEGEVVLDIAQAIGMAPGAREVRVYVAPDAWTTSGNDLFPASNDDTAILNQMVTDQRSGVGCSQLSMSWNWAPENPLNDFDEPVFQTMQGIGQSFFNASGDYGAWNSDFTCSYTTPSQCFFYPEESPNVTAVGGTSLTTSGAGGLWASEGGWSATPCGSSSGYCAGGGGISPDGFTVQPPYYLLGTSYQSGLGGINGTSTVYRNAPDVAMEADEDNYVCNFGSCSSGWGGTSFAAPRWAAFLALANQEAAVNSLPPIGFINPAIYTIGESPNYLADFNEIVGGSNGAYSVVAGEYNMVTGWGSPNGQYLINALVEPGSSTAATPTNTYSETVTQQCINMGGKIFCHPVSFTWTVTLSDSTPGAEIYWQVNSSCTAYASGSNPLSSGGSFGLTYSPGDSCNPSGTMNATAPGYLPSPSVPIQF